ncbi:MAG: ATP-binding protein [Chloroflexota bacterium]
MILSLYTYAKFSEHPYSGFRWDSLTGKVIAIYVKAQSNPALQIGDRLIKIGPVRWADFSVDLRKTIFDGIQVDQIVPLVIERTGLEMTIAWQYPGPNRGEILDLVINEGWLAFVFWLAGTLTLILVRPKDERWYLMIAFNYITAIWLITGSGVSVYRIWGAALLLRMSIWLCVPIYLHLHWVFPKTLGKLPPFLLGGLYMGAIALATGEWFQALPNRLYSVGFLLAAGGSLVLLIIHIVRQPETRRNLRLLLFAAALALVPSIGISLAGTFGNQPALAGGALLSLPFLPLAYFYAAYRRQLSGLEVRVNRIISLYIFLTLIGTAMLFVVTLVATRYESTGAIVSFEIIAPLFIALISALGFPSFQAFVEHYLLGIPFPPKHLQGIYASRITTSASLSSLVQLLKDEILPSLLVRQFVFLRLEKNTTIPLLAIGVADDQIPDDDEIPTLVDQAGKYQPDGFLASNISIPWVRLILTLKVEDELTGVWLFGKRDPDDTYSQTEIAILQSLADQTSIALSNILQTERLRTIYQANINRFEEERLRLALDLHDSVLNQLAVLNLTLDESDVSPDFRQAYSKLTHRLREIVSDLRPAMLSYGLKPVIESLSDNIMERSKDKLIVHVNIQSADVRYPPDIEQHLFRIVQEACENAMQHAHAKVIFIFGQLEPESINLRIEDDGAGFDAGKELELTKLLASKHFGLAGMVERAELIGANIRIDSTPKKGTKVQVVWHPQHE